MRIALSLLLVILAGCATRPDATSYELKRVLEVESRQGISTGGEMLVLANRGERIVAGMPKGLYPGYDREIHEIYVFALRR